RQQYLEHIPGSAGDPWQHQLRPLRLQPPRDAVRDERWVLLRAAALEPVAARGDQAWSSGRRHSGDPKARVATMTLATMIGREWISTPYVAHARAAIPWTRRSVVVRLQNKEMAKMHVASH